jgi:hypothetical protein
MASRQKQGRSGNFIPGDAASLGKLQPSLLVEMLSLSSCQGKELLFIRAVHWPMVSDSSPAGPGMPEGQLPMTLEALR